VDRQFITADSPPHYLNRLEPMTLLSALAVTTEHLGLAATMTTSCNDPFNLAAGWPRSSSSVGGRSGWNVVTSGDAGLRDSYDLTFITGSGFVGAQSRGLRRPARRRRVARLAPPARPHPPPAGGLGSPLPGRAPETVGASSYTRT
jgi:hypothetical protein